MDGNDYKSRMGNTKQGNIQDIPNKDTSAHFRSSHLDQIARVLKTGGRCISFGWNTNGVGKNREFVTEEILIANHGGSHNDTLVTVDRKVR